MTPPELVRVRVSADLLAKVQVEARRQHRSVRNLVERAIRRQARQGRAERAFRVYQRFQQAGRPAERCTCGHSDQEHAPQDALTVGHGPCALPRCACTRFTFATFTPAFERARGVEHRA